jgi:hypothetical protein
MILYHWYGIYFKNVVVKTVEIMCSSMSLLCHHLTASRQLIYHFCHRHGSGSTFFLKFVLLYKTCKHLTARISFRISDVPMVICDVMENSMLLN